MGPGSAERAKKGQALTSQGTHSSDAATNLVFPEGWVTVIALSQGRGQPAGPLAARRRPHQRNGWLAGRRGHPSSCRVPRTSWRPFGATRSHAGLASLKHWLGRGCSGGRPRPVASCPAAARRGFAGPGRRPRRIAGGLAGPHVKPGHLSGFYSLRLLPPADRGGAAAVGQGNAACTPT